MLDAINIIINNYSKQEHDIMVEARPQAAANTT